MVIIPLRRFKPHGEELARKIMMMRVDCGNNGHDKSLNWEETVNLQRGQGAGGSGWSGWS